nr:MAG TPA: ERF superfamily protein [Caudoviricetes sp.]
MANTTTQRTLKEKLFEFQKLGIVIERNAKGYNYTYASYDHIWKNISEKLSGFKLLVSHKIQDYGGNLFLETTVSDMESGDEQSSQIPITANTPQTM